MEVIKKCIGGVVTKEIIEKDHLIIKSLQDFYDKCGHETDLVLQDNQVWKLTIKLNGGT